MGAGLGDTRRESNKICNVSTMHPQSMAPPTSPSFSSWCDGDSSGGGGPEGVSRGTWAWATIPLRRRETWGHGVVWRGGKIGTHVMVNKVLVWRWNCVWEDVCACVLKEGVV